VKSKRDSKLLLSFRSEESLSHLVFSTHEVTFSYRRGDDFFVNDELRVENHASSKIYFSIKGGEAFCDVLPNNDWIDCNSTVEIHFRLKVRAIIDSRKEESLSDLEVLRQFAEKTLFEFAWGESTEEEVQGNRAPPMPYSQILKVKVLEVEDHWLSEIHGQASPQFRSLTQVKISQPVVEVEASRSAENMVDLVNRTHLSSFGSARSEEREEGLLTLPIIAVVALLSFLLGLMTG
jgi:hypothetical protein